MAGLSLRPLLPGRAVEAGGLGSGGTAAPALAEAVTAGGVEVRAGGFRLEGGRFLADVCFEPPDGGDWTVWEASLEFDGKQTEEFGATLLQAESGATRCDTIYFPVSSSPAGADFTLTIGALAAAPREGETCSPDYLAAYQRALDVRRLGIRVDCVVQDLGGGGMEGLAVTGRPASMSQEEAEAIAFSSDVFLEARGVRGPWVFAGSLN